MAYFKHKFGIWAILIMICSIQLGRAQETALFTSLQGNVSVKTTNGNLRSASLRTKLNIGDEVIVGKNAEAAILYYTGKEIILNNPESYIVREEEPEYSIAGRLAKILSDLLWGKDKTEMAAGTVRSIETENSSSIIPVYPVETKIREKYPKFRWEDENEIQCSIYKLTIRSEVSDFKFTSVIEGKNELQYPESAPELAAEDLYVWTVTDSNEYYSKPAHFSLLHSEEIDLFNRRLAEILSICNGNTEGIQWFLLQAALQWEFQLFAEAKKSVLNVLKIAPDFLHAHYILADIYKKMGKIAKAESELIFVEKFIEKE